jgi:hypothetical protein
MIMKKARTFLMGITVALSCAGHAGATDFHSNVTTLWFQGDKSNVLEIAEQRLNTDTNDIAGLILKYEFQLEFLETASLSNSAQRVLSVGATVVSTNFVQAFPDYIENIHAALDFLPHYTPTEILEDKPKALIPYKPLVATDIIKALQDDGYFD